jgi:1,4-alpha-glucan branching enzyme
MVSTPALHQQDFSPAGFEWVTHDDAGRSLLAFVRHAADGSAPVLVLCHFAPAVHRGLRVGVPRAGRWVERLNTDSAHYGGSNVGTPLGAAQSAPVACHGRSDSIVVDLPPLATLMLQWTA